MEINRQSMNFSIYNFKPPLVPYLFESFIQKIQQKTKSPWRAHLVIFKSRLSLMCCNLQKSRKWDIIISLWTKQWEQDERFSARTFLHNTSMSAKNSYIYYNLWTSTLKDSGVMEHRKDVLNPIYTITFLWQSTPYSGHVTIIVGRVPVITIYGLIISWILIG